jgi:hypothetical protein
VSRINAQLLFKVHASIEFVGKMTPPHARELENSSAGALVLRLVGEHLDGILNLARTIPLPRTATSAAHFEALLAGGLGNDVARYPALTKELSSAFMRDVATAVVFVLDPKRYRYSEADFIGEETRKNFPRSSAELLEAGMCLALDRNTACVFHAVRSLEVPMKVIAEALSVTLSPKQGGQSWGLILREVEAGLKGYNGSDRDEYHDAFVYLHAVKGPMRNATMHLDKVYDADNAHDILDAVVKFFKYLPANLREASV